MLFSLTMLPPIGISVVFQDGQVLLFGAAAMLVFFAGFVLDPQASKARTRITTGLSSLFFWLVLGSAGSVPALSDQLNISVLAQCSNRSVA